MGLPDMVNAIAGSKGRNHDGDEPLLSISDVATLMGISRQAVRKACAAGRYADAVKVPGNGGDGWTIPLSSLPQSAQQAYYLQKARDEAANIPNPREQAQAHNQLALDMARKATTAGNYHEPKLQPIPADQAEHKELWATWERAPKKAKIRAEIANKAMIAYENMRHAKIVPKGEIAKLIKEQYGISPPTLSRYRKAIKGQPRSVWVPLLTPRYKGRTTEAEFTTEAWEFIKQQWGSQSKPSITYAIREAMRLASDRGWVIPSHDTVERRIRDLPPWWVTLRRDGVKALEKLYPSQRRDYSTLRLHELWCSDGRKADVFCRWPDGTVSRPIIVGWMDLRSRVILGYSAGKVESADLIRLAFKNAAETCKAIPEAALMDNGRGFASKLLTGGTPNRFRFKVKDEDIPGILTMLGVDVTWATPGHGQAKPIESFWRTLGHMDKRDEFRGAYCANRPDAKPDEFDPKTAVPIETYLRLLQEEIREYHQRSHRGHSMDGKSPRDAYDELLPNSVIRQPTAEQLRLCLLAAEAIRLTPEHQIVVLGNRYWTEKLADLRRDRDYVVRFNPENASDPVSLYEADRFICDVPIIERTGFRDQQAAKDKTRAVKKFVRAKKEQDQAKREIHQAQEWFPSTSPQVPELSAPKLASLVRPKLVNGERSQENEPMMSDEEFNKAFRLGMMEQIRKAR